jgi:translocation and assembly module TamA
VDEELKTNVLAYLSFERYRKSGAELSPDTVERLHERVEREVQSALRPYGYYEPQVESTVTEVSHNEWHVDVEINTGKPVLLDDVDVRVSGPGASDPLFERILARKPRPGARLNHLAYETLKTDLQRTAATYGYLDAKLERNELIVDPPNHKASIVLEMQTGERYRFGETTITQDAVKDQLVRRFLRYHQGDYFDLTQVLRTQFALDDAQYFVNLEVQPAEPDRTLHVVPITIRANARRKNRYSLAPGYATDTGWRVTAAFEDRLLNKEGNNFGLALQFSQVSRYNVQARYGIPIGDPAVESLALRAQIQQQTLADVTATTQQLGPSVTWVTGKWQQVWSVNAVHTTSETIISNQTDDLLVPELDLATVPPGYLGEPLFEHPFFAEIKGSH